MKPTLALFVLALLFLGCETSAPDVQPSASDVRLADPARTSAGVDLARTSAEVAAPDTSLPETNFYEIVVPQGRMVVRLSDRAPRHRDNFKRLVAEGFYDSTLFHRVIDGFMIQGGDPLSRDADPYNDGGGGPGYTVPAELDAEGLFHQRGALAAARQGDNVNPERASSGSQFYLVQGTPYDSTALAEMERMLRERIPDSTFRFSPEAREAYTTEGGTPFLDGQYTVFGELVEGFAVLDSVAAAPTPRQTQQPVPPPLYDRPTVPIPMTIRPLPDYQPPARAEADSADVRADSAMIETDSARVDSALTEPDSAQVDSSGTPD